MWDFFELKRGLEQEMSIIISFIRVLVHRFCVICATGSLLTETFYGHPRSINDMDQIRGVNADFLESKRGPPKIGNEIFLFFCVSQSMDFE